MSKPSSPSSRGAGAGSAASRTISSAALSKSGSPLSSRTRTDFTVYEITNTATPVWSNSVTDITGLATATAFDFLGDGIPEAIYSDEHEAYAFDGKAAHAVRAAEAGYLFSVPPSVVRSQQKQKLVRRLPLESLALESDSPVLGPDPNVRNEPANLVIARDFIAQVHGVSTERVVEVTTANARKVFPVLAP